MCHRDLRHNPGAVSSIAVALVPPVYVMGLMLSGPDIGSIQGPALLYAANLLGILIGGITSLAIREPYFRDKLRGRRRSRSPVLLALIWPCLWVKSFIGGMSKTCSR